MIFIENKNEFHLLGDKENGMLLYVELN